MDFTAHIARVDAKVTGGPTGGPVTYTPGVGTAVDVRGVFDALYEKVEAGNTGVSSSGPAVFLRLSELPSDPSDDVDARVTVAATEYKVREAQPDGMGGVHLLLQVVA
jgi:hypothetical protein